MVILSALALSAAPALADIQYKSGGAAYEICGVSAPGAAELVQKALALPDLELVEQKDQYLTMMQKQKRRFWTFAINDHPAAPAVICRTITPAEGGGSTLAMEISCFADKPACDQLAQDFVAHNQDVLRGAGGI
ncbi:MAG: hypothetical protein ACO1NN_01295 [Sphingopyxis sp.]